MRRVTAVAAHAAAVACLVLTAGPATAGPAVHDHPAPSPGVEDQSAHTGHDSPSGGDHASHSTGDPSGADHSGHETGGTSTGVTDGTRVAVLSGFGAVNAAVVGGAVVLRRRGWGRKAAAR